MTFFNLLFYSFVNKKIRLKPKPNFLIMILFPLPNQASNCEDKRCTIGEYNSPPNA